MSFGKYVVLEGIDGTGKTTQADKLQHILESQGIPVLNLKEPGGSPITEAIRSVILDSTLPRTPMTNILLFTANRHELWHNKIKPALDKGIWVISTRNYWSTLAYQGYGEGMKESVISAITETFTDRRYMEPDYGIILTLGSINESRRRIAEREMLDKPDTFEHRDDYFQERVANGYLAIAQRYDLPIISAAQSIDAVTHDITRIIDQ